MSAAVLMSAALLWLAAPADGGADGGAVPVADGGSSDDQPTDSGPPRPDRSVSVSVGVSVSDQGSTESPTATPTPMPTESPQRMATGTEGARPKYETTIIAPPVVAARAPREDQVAAATVVFPDDSPRAFDDLGDLLAEVPGVTVTRSGGIGDFATVTLRGSNPDEVRVYLDGVPLNLAAGGGIDISTIPLGDVERVEIYRGTTPIGFAESALGGVISIITRAPGERRLRVRAGGGSFGTMFGDASAASRLGPLRVYVGAHALAGDNGFHYYNNNGTTAVPGQQPPGAGRRCVARIAAARWPPDAGSRADRHRARPGPARRRDAADQAIALRDRARRRLSALRLAR
jgi:outer membrane receptor protein involved in Fe transport